MLNSALYEGWIRHRRFSPKQHDFRYGITMLWLDLSELDQVFNSHWLWSVERRNIAAFYRKDHFGDATQDLDDAIRSIVEQQMGQRPTGAIRLLTHPRYFGYVFNPVSFYFCYDNNEQIQTIVAEVSNMPWREQHLYVLQPNSTQDNTLQFRIPKTFHVSPFLPMDLEYAFRFNQPDEDLVVHIEDLQEGQKIFDATLVLKQRPVNTANLSRVLWRFPLMTVQVVFGIHWQALRLWMKKLTIYPHRSKGSV
ncbi:DUF1365 domain-containing protein [Candidatus Albibeggiatoa sp. nov. NOAA]|uniref:DUF1365 domain-containing protein n=1 Tax=Candidatus Albibeggiatoa sp. nov. NOAA TaxID=3162724 RepID=UPI0032F4E155|nr:DUF1365 domain-containing protein [Thiotrichaceae bacterium]